MKYFYSVTYNDCGVAVFDMFKCNNDEELIRKFFSRSVIYGDIIDINVTKISVIDKSRIETYKIKLYKEYFELNEIYKLVLSIIKNELMRV